MQIKELKIFSSNLKEQVEFYAEIIGLKFFEQSESKVVFEIGSSNLTIEYSPVTTPYHFAVNIPSNKETEALAWLNERVPVLEDSEHKIQNFESWNAKAIYFYDRDRNIVELITRKNLQNPSSVKFDQSLFLSVSEIGVPVNNIEREFNFLHTLTGVEIYDGTFERFCAVGDENGLFIFISPKKKEWYPTNDKPHSSTFEIKINEKGADYQFSFLNGKLRSI